MMSSGIDVFGAVQSVMDLGKYQLFPIADAVLLSDYLWVFLLSVILLVMSQYVMRFHERSRDKSRDEAFSFAEQVFEKHTSTVGEMIKNMNRLTTDQAIVRELANLNSNLNLLTTLLNEHIRLNPRPGNGVVGVSGPPAPPPPPPPLPPPPLPTPKASLLISTPQTLTPAQRPPLITSDQLMKTIQSLRKTKMIRKSKSPAKKKLFKSSRHVRTKQESVSKRDSPKTEKTTALPKDESIDEGTNLLLHLQCFSKVGTKPSKTENT